MSKPGKVRRMETKYLIIGNSAGGIGAAEAIREVDREGSLTIVSEEPYPVYSRPLISKYLSGERTLDGMLYRPADFYQRNGITSVLGKAVSQLGLDSRTVELDNGDTIHWQKLLLATGGVPIFPRIEGSGKKGVFTFTTLDDAKAIDECLDKGNKAVVIGGGLIGISVTEALKKRGTEVTVVEMKERILNTILDEQASLMAEERIVQAGVRIIGSHTVSEVVGEDWVTGVVLDDGREISCSLVVVAIGVFPRTELALNAGIGVNRGIVVDNRMATDCADVYACGDAVEAYDFVYYANRPTPIWPNAHIGGRVAGYNMAGVETEYAGGTAMNALNYFGLEIASAGIVIPPSEEEYEVLCRQNGSTYRKAVIKDDLLMGMVFVGDIERSGIVFGLMRDRVNVGSFKQAILSDDFGLAFLPREIWQERLERPPEEAVPELVAFEGRVEDYAGE